MKPFAEYSSAHLDCDCLHVGGYCLPEGTIWPAAEKKINAAFESRLKEEMEKFRGREVRAIESEEVDAKDTQEESDFAYNRALRDAIHAIRSLPLSETEEKP